MKPGPTLVRACPACGAPHRQTTLASGNTFGAVRWTDGYLEAPMWEEPEHVSRCVACDTFFWVEESEVVGQIAESPYRTDDHKLIPSEEVPREQELPSLKPQELMEAIEEGVATSRGEERYLRQLVWWRANHPVRERVRADTETSWEGHAEEVQENLTALLELLEPSDPSDRLARAEALRELGQLADAQKVLGPSFDDPDLQQVARVVKRLASEQVREVRPLPVE